MDDDGRTAMCQSPYERTITDASVCPFRWSLTLYMYPTLSGRKKIEAKQRSGVQGQTFPVEFREEVSVVDVLLFMAGSQVYLMYLCNDHD